MFCQFNQRDFSLILSQSVICLFLGLATAAYAQLPAGLSEVYINMDGTEVNYGVNHSPYLGGPPSYVSVTRNPLVAPPVAPLINPPFYGDISPYRGASILRSRVAPVSPLYGNAPILGSPYNRNLYRGLAPLGSLPYGINGGY